MFRKIAFLFTAAVGMFLCGLAAWADNGLTVDRQPVVAWTLLIGICCAGAGFTQIRQLPFLQQFGLMGTSLMSALLTAVVFNTRLHYGWLFPATMLILLTAAIFWKQKVAVKKPRLNLVA